MRKLIVEMKGAHFGPCVTEQIGWRWWWRLKGGNGEIMAHSSQNFTRKDSCLRSAQTVADALGTDVRVRKGD
ncbi:MAG: YegP family protein [Lentisphaerae bacterium]|nr:YegP family protein [Lentisphaerota bacterium]